MAKKKQIKETIKMELMGITFLGLGLFAFYSIFFINDQNNLYGVGTIGQFVARIFSRLAGEGLWLIPSIIVFWGIKMMYTRKNPETHYKLTLLMLFFNVLAFYHLPTIYSFQTFSDSLKNGWLGQGGGAIGGIYAFTLYLLFGKIGSYILLGTTSLVCLLSLTNTSPVELFGFAVQKMAAFFAGLRIQVINFIYSSVDEEPPTLKVRSGAEMLKQEELPVIIDHTERQLSSSKAERKQIITGKKEIKGAQKEENIELAEIKIENNNNKGFIKPPLDLLQKPLQVKPTRLNKDITENVRILEETLESFGIRAKVTQVSKGPAITRYELQPAPGIKVSRIVNLSDDLALSLAAPQVRVEAPIPGKAAVGIEVPNSEISMVYLKEILETSEFNNPNSLLSVALGKDIAGNPIIADLAKMPHMLIAGATGSGKSVCMNSLIVSLLCKATPNEVKFMMIDPKMVELTTYNGIPHLISPVVTDAKKAATALRWVVNEMENRYNIFAASGVKDIGRYNSMIDAQGTESSNGKLPYIVVLIDELADLMMVAPADVEDAICRIAQMARAAGIHLVLATQRPSVDVITGIIKANIPSRIAFAVSSQVDSRTILDMNGAEKLLGKGDMLYYPTNLPKPIRVQGVYLSDNEIENIVAFLKSQQKVDYQVDNFVNEQSIERVDVEDELLPEAAKIFIESGQASISLLQRRMRVGYNRAARLIDIMEQKGIVGGYEGSKPRQILMTVDEYEKTFGDL